jgi:hypothetical protein
MSLIVPRSSGWWKEVINSEAELILPSIYKDPLRKVYGRQTQNLNSLREEEEAMPSKMGPPCSMARFLFTQNAYVFCSSGTE